MCVRPIGTLCFQFRELVYVGVKTLKDIPGAKKFTVRGTAVYTVLVIVYADERAGGFTAGGFLISIVNGTILVTVNSGNAIVR